MFCSRDVHALVKKPVPEILADFSNCDGVYFQKKIIPTTGERALKKLYHNCFSILQH